MGSHSIEILRQGIWASLTGGWFYDPRKPIFCNTFHLYLWIYLVCAPFTIYLINRTWWIGWVVHLLILGFFTLSIKIVNYVLHRVFDTSPCIVEQVPLESVSNCSPPAASVLPPPPPPYWESHGSQPPSAVPAAMGHRRTRRGSGIRYYMRNFEAIERPVISSSSTEAATPPVGCSSRNSVIDTAVCSATNTEVTSTLSSSTEWGAPKRRTVTPYAAVYPSHPYDLEAASAYIQEMDLKVEVHSSKNTPLPLSNLTTTEEGQESDNEEPKEQSLSSSSSYLDSPHPNRSAKPPRKPPRLAKCRLMNCCDGIQNKEQCCKGLSTCVCDTCCVCCHHHFKQNIFAASISSKSDSHPVDRVATNEFTSVIGWKVTEDEELPMTAVSSPLISQSSSPTRGQKRKKKRRGKCRSAITTPVKLKEESGSHSSGRISRLSSHPLLPISSSAASSPARTVPSSGYQAMIRRTESSASTREGTTTLTFENLYAADEASSDNLKHNSSSSEENLKQQQLLQSSHSDKPPKQRQTVIINLDVGESADHSDGDTAINTEIGSSANLNLTKQEEEEDGVSECANSIPEIGWLFSGHNSDTDEENNESIGAVALPLDRKEGSNSLESKHDEVLQRRTVEDAVLSSSRPNDAQGAIPKRRRHGVIMDEIGGVVMSNLDELKALEAKTFDLSAIGGGGDMSTVTMDLMKRMLDIFSNYPENCQIDIKKLMVLVSLEESHHQRNIRANTLPSQRSSQGSSSPTKHKTLPSSSSDLVSSPPDSSHKLHRKPAVRRRKYGSSVGSSGASPPVSPLDSSFAVTTTTFPTVTLDSITYQPAVLTQEQRRSLSPEDKWPQLSPKATEDNRHFATSFEDTTAGAVHCFQDEHGKWFTYTFRECDNKPNSATTHESIQPPYLQELLFGPSEPKASPTTTTPSPVTPAADKKNEVSLSSSSLSLSSGLTVILDQQNSTASVPPITSTAVPSATVRSNTLLESSFVGRDSSNLPQATSNPLSYSSLTEPHSITSSSQSVIDLNRGIMTTSANSDISSRLSSSVRFQDLYAPPQRRVRSGLYGSRTSPPDFPPILPEDSMQQQRSRGLNLLTNAVHELRDLGRYRPTNNNNNNSFDGETSRRRSLIQTETYDNLHSFMSSVSADVRSNAINSGNSQHQLAAKTNSRQYYKLNLCNKKILKIRFDRLALLSFLDRNLTILESIFNVILVLAIAILGCCILQLNLYHEIQVLIFCVVMASSQYSLFKSVQPDAASPIHGYNHIIIYSRSLYFIMCSLAVLILHHLTSESQQPLHSFTLYGFNMNSLPSLQLVKSVFLYVLLFFPLIFSFGLFPQINTFLMYSLEQLDTHVFGGNGTTSLSSAFYCVGRSLVAVALLYGFAHGGMVESSDENNVHGKRILYSIFCALSLSFSYHLSRSGSDYTALWQLLQKHVLPEELSSSFNRDETPLPTSLEQPTEVSPEEKAGAPPEETSDPLPEKLRSTVLARLTHDMLLCSFTSLLVFLICSSAALPDILRMIHPLALWIPPVIIGFFLHYIIPQLRKQQPWLCIARPVCMQAEYANYEVYDAAKLVWFERLYVWLCLVEKNIIYPVIFLCALIVDAPEVMKNHSTVGPLLIVVCSLKCFRSAFSYPPSQYLVLAFTRLFFAYDFNGISETFLIDYFFMSLFYRKIYELLLKLRFIVTYIAPWQITWGSAFHAFAQPFSVPHSAMLFLQATVSAILSTPLNPVLGSAIFITSYVRPVKFWERDYNTKRMDQSNTRLSTSLLDHNPGADDNNLNSIFYEHLTRSLQHSLCGDLLMGRWGPAGEGDCFVLASDNLNCLVHLIEVGNGLVTFQVRGLEFRGTYCQQREVEAISEGFEEDQGCCCCEPGRVPHLLSGNAAFNQRWLAWEVTATKYVLEGYSISDNAAASMFQMFDLRKILITYYVKSIIYHLSRHPSLMQWLADKVMIKSMGNLSSPFWTDLDPTFHHKIDEDYDHSEAGITRNSFCRVYLTWIEFCVKKRSEMNRQKREREKKDNAKKTEEENYRVYYRGGKYGTTSAAVDIEGLTNKEEETEETEQIPLLKTSPMVSLCLGLSLLARRALGPASHHDNVEFFLHGLHALFKGDFRITCERDEWVFTDMELLKKVVAPAVRMSLKLHLDHFLVPDEYDIHDSLYTAMEEQQSLVIAHEADPCWRSAVLASKPQLLALRHVMDDGDVKYKIIMLNKRHLLFRVIKVNRECVRGLWAGQQQELVYLRNRNPERGSIQNAKQALRNMINSSCDQPIGYPIYVSPLTTSYSHTHPDYERLGGAPITPHVIKELVCSLCNRIKERCAERCSSGSSNIHSNTNLTHVVTSNVNQTLAPVVPGGGNINGGGSLSRGSVLSTSSSLGTSTGIPPNKQQTSSTALASLAGLLSSENVPQQSPPPPPPPPAFTSDGVDTALGLLTTGSLASCRGREWDSSGRVGGLHGGVIRSRGRADTRVSSVSSADEDDKRRGNRRRRTGPRNYSLNSRVIQEKKCNIDSGDSVEGGELVLTVVPPSSPGVTHNDSLQTHLEDSHSRYSPSRFDNSDSGSNSITHKGSISSLQEAGCSKLEGRVRITDANLIYDTLNLGRRIDVQWPDEEMRIRGGRNYWNNWVPIDGMEGVIVHTWHPNHSDPLYRSHVNRVIGLVQIGSYFVPVGEGGLEKLPEQPPASEPLIDQIFDEINATKQ